MLPSVVAVYRKDVIEDHCAEPQHDEFADAPYIKCSVETVRFERLPSGAVLIAEGRDIFAQDVSQEAKLEAFMERICRDNDVVIALNQQHLTSFRVRKKLDE